MPVISLAALLCLLHQAVRCGDEVEIVEVDPIAGGVEMPALLEGRVGDRRNAEGESERAAGGGSQTVHGVVGIKLVEVRAGLRVLAVNAIARLIIAVIELGKTPVELCIHGRLTIRPKMSRPG